MMALFSFLLLAKTHFQHSVISNPFLYYFNFCVASLLNHFQLSLFKFYMFYLCFRLPILIFFSFLLD